LFKIKGPLSLIQICFLILVIVVYGPHITTNSIEEVLSTLQKIKLRDLAILILVCFAQVVMLNIRSISVLRYLGLEPAFLEIFRANLNASVASLIVPLPIAQIISRRKIFQQKGYEADDNLIPIIFEKFMVLLVSVTATAVALFILSSEIVPDVRSVETVIILMMAIFAALIASFSQEVRRLFSRVFAFLIQTKTPAFPITPLLYSVITQAFGMLSILIACYIVNIRLELSELICATAIILFISSMPLSPNSFGTREFSFVLVLTHLGTDSPSAFSAGLILGFSSHFTNLFVLLIVQQFVSKKKFVSHNSVVKIQNDALAQKNGNYAMFLPLIYTFVCMCAGLLALIQVFVPFGETTISVNLGDPLAFLAGCLLLSKLYFEKIRINWKFLTLKTVLITFGGLICFSYFNGYLYFGSNDWALVNRFSGLFILFGYFFAGCLSNNLDIERPKESIILLGAFMLSCVILSDFCARALGLYDAPGNFQALAGNRNTLALQATLFVSALIAMGFLKDKISVQIEQIGSPKLAEFLVYVLSFGIILTASRTGIVALSVIAVVALYLGLIKIKQLGIILVLFFLLSSLNASIQFSKISEIMGPYSAEISDVHRWEQYKLGLVLFLEKPLLGSGLGYFFEKHEAAYGVGAVMHNTIFWMLIEFGLIGTILLGWFVFQLFRKSIYQVDVAHEHHVELRLLVAISIPLLLFSLLHDVAYQRIFWFLLGLIATDGVISKTSQKLKLRNMEVNN